MKRPAILFAIGLVVVTNTVALALAAYNRMGVESTLTLTDRELWLNRWNRESTATTVSLQYLYPVADRTDPWWFGCDRLTAIGFDCSVPASDPRAEVFYAHQSARNAFVVLEYNGAAWQAYEAEAERLNARQVAQGGGLNAEAFAREMAGRSRLIAIDAGPDSDALRRAYPDGSRYLVTAARVSITRYSGGRDYPSYIRGNITEILPDTITVPRAFAATIRAATVPAATQYWATGRPSAPSYTITVNYGRRHEPWITDVTVK